MKTIIILIVLFLLVSVAVYGIGRDGIDRRVVETLDIDRYMGQWYEIARFDNSFEEGLVDVHATYHRRADGAIEVVNSGVDMRNEKPKVAKGKVKTTSLQGRLRVSFFWFFYSDYNILELDKDYQWVLVGSRSAKYLWILSRTPRLSAETLNHILGLAEQRGYKTEKLLFIDQSARLVFRW